MREVLTKSFLLTELILKLYSVCIRQHSPSLCFLNTDNISKHTYNLPLMGCETHSKKIVFIKDISSHSFLYHVTDKEWEISFLTI